MKTKLFTLCAALCCACSLCATEFVVGGIKYNTLGGDSVEVISNSYSGDITIPASITYDDQTYRVTSIGYHAFYECTSLTSVIIGDRVAKIGSYAFCLCTGLTSIEIPNSVTSIGERAFQGCSGLTSVEIPNSVTIGNWAFSDCTSLTSPLYNANYFIHIPTNYSGSYIIPDGIKQIVGGAFDYCSGLTSVEIPNSVTSIGSSAFFECTGLASVEIPNSVTSIGNWAFLGCTGLTSVTIPEGVTSIGESVFQGCTGLTSVVIPNSVTSIGKDAFYGCSNLTSVNIPNSVIEIGRRAFYNVMNINYTGRCVNYSPWGALHVNGYNMQKNPVTIYQNCDSNFIPSINAPAAGKVIIAVRVPDNTCNGIVAVGSNGTAELMWDPSGTDFEAVENTEHWYKVELTYAADMQVKVIAKDEENAVTWNTQWGMNTDDKVNVSIISGDGELVLENGGEVKLTTLTDRTVIYIDINDWKSNPCIEYNKAGKATFSLTCPALPDDAQVGIVGGTLFNEIGDTLNWNLIKPIIMTMVEAGKYTAEAGVTAKCQYKYAYKLVDGEWSWDNMEDGGDRDMVVSLKAEDEVSAWKNLDAEPVEYNEAGSVNFVITITNKEYAEGDKCILAGNFAEKSWDNSDREMAYDAEAKVWKLTCNVPANFEFKVIYNGSWAEGDDVKLLKDLSNATTSFTIYGVSMVAPKKQLTNAVNATLILKTKMCGEIFSYNYSDSTLVLLRAIPDDDHTFVKWSDGNTENPRMFVVASDTTLTAIFDDDEEDDGKTEDDNTENEDNTIHNGNLAITPTETTALFVWPAVENAYSYSLIIWANAEQTEKVCTLTFNSNGQLTGIDFSKVPNKAPKENNSGLNFKVTGLEPGTTYAYTLDALDENGAIIDRKTGTFLTEGATAVENVQIAGLYTENGRIICENAEDMHIYTVTGIDVTSENGHLQGVYIVKCGEQTTKVVVK